MTTVGEKVDAAVTLAKYVVDTKYEDIPAEVLEVSKKDILDILATAVGGSTAPGCKEIVELVKGWGAQRKAPSSPTEVESRLNMLPWRMVLWDMPWITTIVLTQPAIIPASQL